MASTDRKRAREVADLADVLMNSKPLVNPVVRNTDVIAALIGDLLCIANSRAPFELERLTKIAREAGEL